MWDDVVKPLGLIIIGIILFLWAATYGIYKYDVEIAEANMVDVYLGNAIVYQGKQAFIKVDSGGMTTHVTIYKNLYPAIVYQTFSSNDIKVMPQMYRGEK